MAVILHIFWSPDLKGEENPQVGGFMAIWGGYTFVLGFLIVFRNNQAYNRFWEAASKMHELRGELFNCASTLCAYCCEPKKFGPEGSREHAAATGHVDEFQHLLVRLMSLLFSSCCHDIASEDPHIAQLKSKSVGDLDIQAQNLNKKAGHLEMQVLDLGGVQAESLVHLNEVPSRCEVTSQWIYRLIIQKQREEPMDGMQIKVLDVPPPILGRPLADLASALGDLYRARKIAEIPFPFPYAQMILDMLLVFCIVTPVQPAGEFNSDGCSGNFLVTAGYWALFLIADEIDQPFGGDPNDLNLSNMQRDFNASLITLLDRKTQTVPSFRPHQRLQRNSTTVIGSRFRNPMQAADEVHLNVGTPRSLEEWPSQSPSHKKEKKLQKKKKKSGAIMRELEPDETEQAQSMPDNRQEASDALYVDQVAATGPRDAPSSGMQMQLGLRVEAEPGELKER
eukprot:CAMPEP_0181538022 /NCGR_PEP_ID=MMETSP1110-20121109/75650_1 /TAXON_ID=174948 /ORGANISM="Symbiodinium sp., Strain CCMP421" /LENGTH=451 /DNA_ID=CAMNT_0023669607 /DNA_START=93 /DNA_END=1447 /DNA_ORIENTATION=-